jgi:multiple sugar transport system permease protein
MKTKKIKDRDITSATLETDLKNPSVKIVHILLTIIMLTISLSFIIPVLWVFVSAFKDTKEFLQMPPKILPKSFDLSKVGAVWEKTSLAKAYISTIYMMAGSLVVSLVSNGLAGYVLSRLKPKGSKTIIVAILWSMMLPSGLSMVPLFISFTKEIPLIGVNLLDSYLPLWLMSGASAFNVLLFKSFFDGIPKSYLEAARIDGCSETRIFTRIVMPLSKPVFMSVAIFVFTGGWGSFMWPYLLIKNENMMPIGVRTYILQPALPQDEYFMMLIFVIVPPIIFFCIFQKYLMDGVSLGGVKG